MSKITRTRIAPTPDTDTHEIYGRGGLGTGDAADAEAVYPISDHISWGSAVISNAGSGEVWQSAWKACADSRILRLNAIYRASTGEREMIVVGRDHADLVGAISGIITPTNTGVETAASSGLYFGAHWFVINVEGMKDFKVVVLPGAGGGVDVYAEVG